MSHKFVPDYDYDYYLKCECCGLVVYEANGKLWISTSNSDWYKYKHRPADTINCAEYCIESIIK